MELSKLPGAGMQGLNAGVTIPLWQLAKWFGKK